VSALTSTAPASRGAGRRRLAAYRTVRPDLVEVVMGGQVVGYLEMVGSLFVALRGTRYDLAVEVAQSMSIEAAHAALCTED
jgi:hypothetical protein